MTPQAFPEANKVYRAPEGFEDSQVMPIPVWEGAAKGGSCDGQTIVVVAWKPTLEELQQLAVNGAPIFLSMFGGLAPHMLTTNFHDATHPA